MRSSSFKKNTTHRENLQKEMKFNNIKIKHKKVISTNMKQILMTIIHKAILKLMKNIKIL